MFAARPAETSRPRAPRRTPFRSRSVDFRIIGAEAVHAIRQIARLRALYIDRSLVSEHRALFVTVTTASRRCDLGPILVVRAVVEGRHLEFGRVLKHDLGTHANDTTQLDVAGTDPLLKRLNNRWLGSIFL